MNRVCGTLPLIYRCLTEKFLQLLFFSISSCSLCLFVVCLYILVYLLFMLCLLSSSSVTIGISHCCTHSLVAIA